MWDKGGYSKGIDIFEITFPYPSDIHEKEYTGNRGIANITLSAEIKCIDPDACNSPAVSSENTGTKLA